ncbi:hypothetical protein OAO87_02070 [bacterium]|nr:hypothetical protein [bacterium]
MGRVGWRGSNLFRAHQDAPPRLTGCLQAASSVAAVLSQTERPRVRIRIPRGSYSSIPQRNRNTQKLSISSLGLCGHSTRPNLGLPSCPPLSGPWLEARVTRCVGGALLCGGRAAGKPTTILLCTRLDAPPWCPLMPHQVARRQRGHNRTPPFTSHAPPLQGSPGCPLGSKRALSNMVPSRVLCAHAPAMLLPLSFPTALEAA